MGDKKKDKLSPSDVQLLLAQMAQALANTPGTMAGAQSALEGAKNTAASEYQDKVAKEQEKAKKGGVFGQLGQVGGMALGGVLGGPLGATVGGSLGGVAGHAAAGEQIDPMAAVFNMGLNAATQYGLPKVQEALGSAANPGDWSRVDRTAQTSSRQIRSGPEAPLPEDAPLVPSPAPQQAPPQAQPYQAPEYQFGGASAAGPPIPGQAQGGNWKSLSPPQGQAAPTPQGQSGLQMNINDQGLSQSLPMPGARQAQAPQQDFVGRLATNIAQAIQQVGLPQMSVVTPRNVRVPRALDAGTASAIRNEGVQQDFQRAQLANQTAQTAATTANTQLSQNRFDQETARIPIEDERWNKQFAEEQAQTAETRGARQDTRIYQQTALEGDQKYRTDQQRLDAERDAATMEFRNKQLEIDRIIANKPSGGSQPHPIQYFQNANGESGVFNPNTGEVTQFAASITNNNYLTSLINTAAGGGEIDMTTMKAKPGDAQVAGQITALASKYAQTMKPEEAVNRAIQDVKGFQQMWGGSTGSTASTSTYVDPANQFGYSPNGSLKLGK